MAEQNWGFISGLPLCEGPQFIILTFLEVTCFVFNKEKRIETELEPLAGCW